MMSIKERKRKYLKDKYFEVYDRNPFQYCPTSDKTIHLTPVTTNKIIDLLIHILEQENWDGVNWVKTT